MSINDKDVFILAPLQGLTDYEFRNAYSKIFPNSFEMAVTPFISLTHGNNETSKKKYRDVLPENNKNNIKLIPQVLGNDEKGIIEVANGVYNLGYRELNINLGCSVKRITRKTRGSALMKDTEELERILNKVCKASPCSISLKLRLGYDINEDIFRLIPIINSLPISSVIIHPRLGIEDFSSQLDLDSFEKAYSLIKTKLVYNGEIRTKEDFNKLKSRFPNINSWMIGRGVLNNPTLIEEIKSTKPTDKRKKIMDLSNELINNSIRLNNLKEFWTYFSIGFGISPNDYKLLLESNSLEEFIKIINKLMEFDFEDEKE